MKTQILFQENQFEDLQHLIQENNFSNIFLVRGDKSFKDSGADSFIEKLVSSKRIVSFLDFDTNPQLNDLIRGVELFRKSSFDLIIAIGGGSVLDMAKLISVFAHQKGAFDDIIRNNRIEANAKTPLLAIPTTAGTGAEATHFAVVYIDKSKYSVANSNILPDYVFLSSEFSASAQSYLTACTGLDAFSQAIESVWSVNSNSISEEFALKAIDLIWNNLANAANSNDKASKYVMQNAAYLAGKAINITKTTAPHAISYSFTSYYNIPHGHAVSLSLPFFMKYNYYVSELDCMDERGVDSIRDRMDKIMSIFNCNINTVEFELVKFFRALGIEINISKLISNLDKDLIVSNINTERLNNNPRKVTKRIINLFLEEYI